MRSLNNEVECEFALAGFDVITATRPALHLPVTRLLHQQQLLEFVLVRIVKSPTDLQLCAFAYVLRAMPVAVLTINITPIVPLLFQGLGQARPDIVAIYIGVVDTLIGRKSDVILGHLNRLIPLYLQLCTFKGSLVCVHESIVSNRLSYAISSTENPRRCIAGIARHRSISDRGPTTVQAGRPVCVGRTAGRPEATGTKCCRYCSE